MSAISTKKQPRAPQVQAEVSKSNSVILFKDVSAVILLKDTSDVGSSGSEKSELYNFAQGRKCCRHKGEIMSVESASKSEESKLCIYFSRT